MKRVKITDGLYGYRPEGAKHPPAGACRQPLYRD